MIKLLFILAISVQSLALEQQFDAKQLDSIKIQNSSGNIHFVSHNKPIVMIKTSPRTSHPGCQIEVKSLDKKLNIKNLNHQEDKEDTNCKTDFEIALPSYFAMDIRNGFGDLKVIGMKSSLNFRIGLGDVLITSSELNRASGVTGKGHITANHLMTGAKFRTGKGDIKVSYLKPPQKGALDLKTGSGNAFVQLPQKSRTKIHFQSALGNLKSHIQSDLRAPFSIKMQSGMGSLDISSLKDSKD